MGHFPKFMCIRSSNVPRSKTQKLRNPSVVKRNELVLPYYYYFPVYLQKVINDPTYEDSLLLSITEGHAGLGELTFSKMSLSGSNEIKSTI